MFYKLKENFALRGWQQIPKVLLDLNTNKIEVLNNEEFETLKNCDGKTNLQNTENFKNILKTYENLKIIEKFKTPHLLNENQKFRFYNNKYIKNLHWSITGKCNFKCRHCYLNASEAKFGEISYKTCIDFIKQFEECGILNVSLTGGEPLIRENFFDIVKTLCDKNIKITTIDTNGYLINEDFLKKIESKKINPEFSISFDGIGWHDWLRGVKGAEKAAINAFKVLKKRNFKTSAGICVHKHNINCLEETIDLLTELGVSTISINQIVNSGKWRQESAKNNIEQKEIFNFYLKYIPKFFKKKSPVSLILGGFFYCKKGSKDYEILAKKFCGTKNALNQAVCGHAKENLYIGPDSSVLPCMPLLGVESNIKKFFLKETSLKKIISSKDYLNLINMQFNELLKNNPKCEACEKKFFCGGGCRACGTISSGNFFGCDEDMCTFFNGNYEKKIHNIISKVNYN
ncbi:MAG: radical SAM protein [Oscillospiraceae bacterium]|jgi:radical SAM protein with 4Fe4S-binding SPASM domain|nr:radical SAM protein [Oscillospiraceae bacterium]